METDGGGHQAVKAALNQALCREVNERIRSAAETAGHVLILCECAAIGCTETLNMSVAEYERIRSSWVRFPIALGHDVSEVENVVEDNERFAIVRKRGKAAEVSAKLDPRTG